jgi:hypothetical protein
MIDRRRRRDSVIVVHFSSKMYGEKAGLCTHDSQSIHVSVRLNVVEERFEVTL